MNNVQEVSLCRIHDAELLPSRHGICAVKHEPDVLILLRFSEALKAAELVLEYQTQHIVTGDSRVAGANLTGLIPQPWIASIAGLTSLS